jgi:thiol peroxidase
LYYEGEIMVDERRGLLKLAGKDVVILGSDLNIGDQAPEFEAVANDWEPVRVLAQSRGKVRIIAAVPSLETAVCDRETRTFNQAASDLDENIMIITVSTDLPFTQARWCGAAGIERVLVVSDHLSTDFGLKYGCLIKERRILRRAVFVVNQDDTVVYVDYMKALGDEPDYQAVLQAAEQTLGQ